MMPPSNVVIKSFCINLLLYVCVCFVLCVSVAATVDCSMLLLLCAVGDELGDYLLALEVAVRSKRSVMV